MLDREQLIRRIYLRSFHLQIVHLCHNSMGYKHDFLLFWVILLTLSGSPVAGSDVPKARAGTSIEDRNSARCTARFSSEFRSQLASFETNTYDPMLPSR